MKAGFDIGNVLHVPRASPHCSIDGPHFRRMPEIPDAVDVLRRLIAVGTDVCLVSKCSPGEGRKVLEWMDHHYVYQRTGLDPDRVYFCLRRDEKRRVIENLGGLDVFVDDRAQVLSYLYGVVGRRYLFRPSSAGPTAVYAPSAAGVRMVSGWLELERELLGMVYGRWSD